MRQGAGHLRYEEVEAEAVDPDVELAAELAEGQAVDALLEHLVRGRVRGRGRVSVSVIVRVTVSVRARVRVRVRVRLSVRVRVRVGVARAPRW